MTSANPQPACTANRCTNPPQIRARTALVGNIGERVNPVSVSREPWAKDGPLDAAAQIAHDEPI